MIDAHGGHDEFWAYSNARLAEFNEIWNQDMLKIGRVLRVHLSVEHFLTRYIQYVNPRLGPIERMRFADKIKMIGAASPVIGQCISGLKRLNEVRNRIAHNLRVDINQDDVNSFLSVAIFKAMREAKGDPSKLSTDPLEIYEEFGMFVAGHFFVEIDPKKELWNQGSNFVDNAPE